MNERTKLFLTGSVVGGGLMLIANTIINNNSNMIIYEGDSTDNSHRQVYVRDSQSRTTYELHRNKDGYFTEISPYVGMGLMNIKREDTQSP